MNSSHIPGRMNARDYLAMFNNTANAGKRGMSLEDDVNESNAYYVAREIASIHKKPTPVQIVKVDYPVRSAAVIKEAYFRQPSTTDYNGVFAGKYIDFEAKETKNKTSFPLANFHPHQIEHIKLVLKQKGIAFTLIRFCSLQETYLLDGEHLIDYWEKSKQGERKSIPYGDIKKLGHLIPEGYQPRLDYLKVVKDVYIHG